MDLSKLRAFIIVAEELNFRRSAEILGMSQPPLTRLIAGLEEELSSKLFDRNTRHVSLTGAGVHLLKEGREILAKAEQVGHEIRSISALQKGKLSIGFSATAFLANLPRTLNEFRNRFTEVKLDLQQESPERLLKGLRHGAFDICFLEGTASDEGFATHVVRDEKLGVLLPKGHAFAKRKRIQFEELENETIIMHPKEEGGRFVDAIHRHFKQSGIKPRIYIKNEREHCPILVAIGKGVSLTISNGQCFSAIETCFVPIKKFYLPVVASWRPEDKNPSLKCFVSFVMESAAMRKQETECLADVMRF